MGSWSSSCVMLTPSFASAAWAWVKKPVAASQRATDELVRIFRVIALNVTDPNEAGSIQNPEGLLPKWHTSQKGRAPRSPRAPHRGKKRQRPGGRTPSRRGRSGARHPTRVGSHDLAYARPDARRDQ